MGAGGWSFSRRPSVRGGCSDGCGNSRIGASVFQTCAKGTWTPTERLHSSLACPASPLFPLLLPSARPAPPLTRGVLPQQQHAGLGLEVGLVQQRAEEVPELELLLQGPDLGGGGEEEGERAGGSGELHSRLIQE